MGRLLAAAATALVSIGASSCGDDEGSATTTQPVSAAPAAGAEGDADSPADSSSPVSEPSATSDVETTANTESTNLVEDTVVEDTGVGVSVDDTGVTGTEVEQSQECTEIAAVIAKGESAEFEDVDELLIELKGFAPDDIDASLDVLVAAVAEAAAVIADSGLTFAEAQEDDEVREQIDAILEEPETREAADALEKYFEQLCPSLTM